MQGKSEPKAIHWAEWIAPLKSSPLFASLALARMMEVPSRPREHSQHTICQCRLLATIIKPEVPITTILAFCFSIRVTRRLKCDFESELLLEHADIFISSPCMLSSSRQ
jgi:hypothetical protein